MLVQLTGWPQSFISTRVALALVLVFGEIGLIGGGGLEFDSGGCKQEVYLKFLGIKHFGFTLFVAKSHKPLER